MVCLSRPYPFKSFKGCLLGPFLNTLSQIRLFMAILDLLLCNLGEAVRVYLCNCIFFWSVLLKLHWFILIFVFLHSICFYVGFLSETLTIKGKVGEKSRPSLLFFANSIRSRIFRYLFAYLHLRWLLRIFNSIVLFTRLLLGEIYPPIRN